ncbi:hypothetical protein J6590_029631 [Homalodisca vitripennis]|nr:hypothetical protein J6590_029631 [Homalodisca vitripennis]
MVFKEWRFLQSGPRNYSHRCTSTQLPSWRSLSGSPSLLSFTQAVITRLRYQRKPEHKHTTPFLAVSSQVLRLFSASPRLLLPGLDTYISQSTSTQLPSWRSLSGSPSLLSFTQAVITRLRYLPSPRLLLPGLDTYVSQSTRHKHTTPSWRSLSGSPSLLSFTQAVITRLRYLRKPEHKHTTPFLAVLRLFSASPRLLLPGLDTYVSQSTSTQLPSWRSLSGSPSLLSFTQAVITRLRYLRKPEHKHTTPFLAVLRLFSASPRLLLPGLDTYVSQSTSTQLPSWRSLSGSPSLLSFTQAVITQLRYLSKPVHKHTTPFLAVLRLFSASPRLLLPGLDTYVSQCTSTQLPSWRSLSGSPSLLSFTQAVITRLRYLRKPVHKHTTPFLAVLRLFSASPRLLLPGLDTYVSQCTSTQLPSWRSLSGSPSLLSFTQAVITRLRYLRKPEHKHTTPFLAVSLRFFRLFSASPRLLLPGLDTYVSQSTSTQLPSWRSLSGSPSLLSFTQAVITRLRYLRKPEHKHTTPFLAVLRLFSASPRLLLPGLDTYVSQSTSTQLPSWRSLSGSPSLLSFTQAVITRLRYLRKPEHKHTTPFLAVLRLFSASPRLLLPGLDTYVSQSTSTQLPSWRSLSGSPSLLSFTQAVITRLRYLRKPEHKHTTPFLAVSLRAQAHPFLAVSLGSPSLLSFTQAVITRLRYLRKPEHKHTTLPGGLSQVLRLFSASPRLLLPGLDTYVSQSTSTQLPSWRSLCSLRLFSASPRLLLPGLDTYVSQSTSTQLPSWRSLSGSPSLLSFTQAVITRLRYLRKPEHKHTTPFLAVLRLFSASPRLLLPGLDTYVSQSTSTQLPSWRSLSGSPSLLSFTQAVITRLRYLRKPEHKHTTPFLAVLRLFSASPRLLLPGLDTYVSQSTSTQLPSWRSLSGSPSLLSFTQAVITRLRYLRKPEHKHTSLPGGLSQVLRLFSASPRLLLPGLDTYVSQSTSTQLPSWRSLSGSPSLLSFTQAVITRLRYLRKPVHKHTSLPGGLSRFSVSSQLHPGCYYPA